MLVDSIICFAFALLFNLVDFIQVFDYSHYRSSVYFLNYYFPLRLILPVALWIAEKKLSSAQDDRSAGMSLGLIAHIIITVLLAVETNRWTNDSDLISGRMGISIISALWALQALSLTVFGLIKRRKEIRILGFILFGVTCFKVCFIDMTSLDKVYRIVSFAGSGLFFVIGGYFYQKFSKALLKDSGNDTDSNTQSGI